MAIRRVANTGEHERSVSGCEQNAKGDVLTALRASKCGYRSRGLALQIGLPCLHEVVSAIGLSDINDAVLFYEHIKVPVTCVATGRASRICCTVCNDPWAPLVPYIISPPAEDITNDVTISPCGSKIKLYSDPNLGLALGTSCRDICNGVVGAHRRLIPSSWLRVSSCESHH